jgi:hypothetical protein
MQDKYTGDIGDFGKYTLLNKLSELSNNSITLGVNWYYVDKTEKKSGDGRHINYLNSQNPKNKLFKECDPRLYEKLKSIVQTKKRNISEIEAGHVLPKNTVFYSVPLPYASGSIIQRSGEREDWFLKSLKQLKKTDILFLDPDNGIQTSKLIKSDADAVKHVFLDEIYRYYQNEKSLIIYQHRDRTPKLEYDKKFNMLADMTGCEISILRFKRVSVRNYIFLPQPKDKRLFNKLCNRLTLKPYDFLFEKYILG